MARPSSFVLTIFSTMIIFSSFKCEAQLTPTFYDQKCPRALATIKSVVDAAVAKQPGIAASLIRLSFHDCFVQGCDGSILLEDTPKFTGERTASSNGDLRGFEVLNDAKKQLESICPGIVSCADILAVAARDSSVAVKGPSWTMNLGRRDSTTANLTQADSDLPSLSDSLDKLISLFSNKGLNERDMVALSGAHTIGQAACPTFLTRIHDNASDIDPKFAATRKAQCPEADDDGNFAPFDLVTPDTFDNNYFKDLIAKRGLLPTDQILFSNGSTDSIVVEYSKNDSAFKSDFAAAMVKVGNIAPLTGTEGEIRKICGAVN